MIYRVLLTIFLLVFSFSMAEAKKLGIPASQKKQEKQKDSAVESISSAKRAIEMAKRRYWPEARSYAKKSGMPQVFEIVQWMQFSDVSDDPTINFYEISNFIKNHPDWPDQSDMHNNAEQSIKNSLSPKEIINFFKNKNPETRKGMEATADALLKLYPRDEKVKQKATQLLKEAWIKGNFTADEERDFYHQYNNILRTEDHIDRINRLLADERIESARNSLRHVSEAYSNLFEARMRLIKNKGDAMQHIKLVPAHLVKDEGLQYDLARWYGRREKFDRAASIITNYKDQKLSYPEKWWNLRSYIARELILQKEYKKAYDLVSSHQIKEGNEYAEAEWLAGWISLRFLNDPKTAYKHFYSLYHNVKMPVSLSRAAYWAGRAAESSGQEPELVKDWYQVAANNSTTFYGQMAALKIGLKNVSLDEPSPPSAEEIINVHNNELVKVFNTLLRLNEPEIAKMFLMAAVNNIKSTGEAQELINIVAKKGRKELIVVVAKNAISKGIVINESGYPLLFNNERNSVRTDEIESALVHAIVRQESMFDKDARSSAGALGLMQIMPATAHSLSRRLRMSYSQAKLTSNPEYNVRLGSFYLNDLINNFDGSYILAIAAYNAGQGNVKKWLNSIGDPRRIKNHEDVIDWMEMIPFKETRNYVQRVTEGLQVYRYVLSKHDLQENQKAMAMIFLDKDITRNNFN